MAYRVAPLAETDLDEIWFHIARESGLIYLAERLVDSLTDRFGTLANFPQVGLSRETDLGPGCQSFPAEGYLIFYEVIGNDIRILRVLHGRRNIGLLFPR